VEYPLGKLAEYVDGYVVGDENCRIDGIATLKNAAAGHISFFTNKKYKNDLLQTTAAAVILKEEDLASCPVNALVVSDPHPAYAKIASLITQTEHKQQGIHPTASIAEGCSISETAWIDAHVVIAEGAVVKDRCRIAGGCYIGRDSVIGEDSQLMPNVTVMHECTVGDRVILHSGVVIGADGFGQAYEKGRWIKVPQLGGVIIGDDVEIGANTTVDRGAIEATLVGKGVKLDNLIQIAHNVQIGENTVIAAGTAIAGSTHIGRNCIIGGCVGIVGHISIAEGVTITGRSAVLHSIKEAGVYSSGTPLEPNRQWHKNHIRFKKLDDMAKQLKGLEKEIDKLRG